MKKFYFTCGQIHIHKLENGKVWDKHSMIEVQAETENKAVAFVFEKFGQKWAAVYDEPQGLEFAANGIVASYMVNPVQNLVEL